MKLKALMKVIDKETFVMVIKSGCVIISGYKGTLDYSCEIDSNVKLIKNRPEYMSIFIA